MHICQFVPYGSKFWTYGSVYILKSVLITKCIITRSRDASRKVPVQTQEVVRICNGKITMSFLDLRFRKKINFLRTCLQCFNVATPLACNWCFTLVCSAMRKLELLFIFALSVIFLWIRTASFSYDINQYSFIAHSIIFFQFECNIG